MKKLQYLFLLFLTVLVGLVSCQRNSPVSTGEKAAKEESKTISQSGGIVSGIDDFISKKDSAETRQDTLKTKYYEPYYPIQKDTAMYHRFGDLTLKKDNLTGFYNVKNIGGYGLEGVAYYERYPGILNKQVHQGNKPVEVIFYDENRKSVVNRVDLEKLNPYLGKYKNIKLAYPSPEYYEAPFENEKHLYLNTEPDTFMTFYEGGHTLPNGYTTVTYSLVPVKDNKIFSWETTTVILDRQGNVLAEHPEDNRILPALLSDDGQLLAYTYGMCPDNPYDQAPNGEFKIIDLPNKEVVLNLDGGASFGNDGYIHRMSHYSTEPPFEMEIELINLNTRIRFIRKFSKEDIKAHFEKHKTWKSLLNNTNFSKTKF